VDWGLPESQGFRPCKQSFIYKTRSITNIVSVKSVSNTVYFNSISICGSNLKQGAVGHSPRGENDIEINTSKGRSRNMCKVSQNIEAGAISSLEGAGQIEENVKVRGDSRC
jgi:hypothetical protein